MHLAIDLGTTKMGLAIGNADNAIVTRLPLVEAREDQGRIQKITTLVEEYGITTIILGLPLHADGTESEWTRAVRDFGELLKKSIPQVQVELVNEFISSQFTKEQNAENPQIKKQIDSEVARLLLEEYFSR